MAGAFDAKVDISTKEAVDGLRAIRSEAKLLGTTMAELDGILRKSNGALKETADNFTKYVAAQRQATAGAKELAQERIANARATGIEAQNNQKAAESTAKVAREEANATRAVEQANLAAERGFSVSQQRIQANARNEAATRRATEAQDRMNDGLSNSRYLMYDVGATYGVLAAGLMTIPAATAAVSAAYQRDFAQVLRVNEDLQNSPQAAQGLKDSLKAMATDMPIGFDELSRITQLGAQMGVDNDKLAQFTETTAKFVAVTGISADSGATLFGRMETSFTADVAQYPDFFERLGSSIADVGAKTVATDPEIASMLNQIGPLGASAGMSAANVTGLAAALASVRVQPELARGTLTRVFGQLNRDVAEGSPKMAEFGKLMGLSGDAAGKLWKSDSSKFFTDLIAGLNAAQIKNGELTTTFDKLGITASRDVSALTKLAVGNDVLVKSMAAANKGFEDGTALNKMSKVTFETVIAKLTEMANAWKNLGDTLGSGALAPLAVFVDMAKNVALGLDSLIHKVPAIGWLITALMGLASVTAAFLGFRAAQAFVMAGMIGFQQASARGMGAGMGLSNMARTLAQTMLMAKGATDQQSRALLEQVGATRALMIASSTSSAQLRTGVVGSYAEVAAASGKAAGGIKGASSALLGMVGGPVGIAVTALALLAGHFISTAVEAEQAGKTIADAMAQGADAGMRAIATVVKEKKAGLGDNMLVGWGTSMADIADQTGVGMDKVVTAISKGKNGLAEFQQQLEDVAKSKGYDGINDMVSKNTAFSADGQLAAKLEYLKTHTEELAGAQQSSAKTTDIANKALTALKVPLSAAGDEADTTATDIDKMTKALKDLNDQVFGTINAESDLQDALAKTGEGLQKSHDISPFSEGGRTNLKNVEDSMSKSRDYYNQLFKDQQLTAQEAAQGYSDFVDNLFNELRAKGGDTSYIQDMANNTKAKFMAAIGGQPVMIPVGTDTKKVTAAALDTVNLVQNWIKSNPATLAIGANADPAYAQLSGLAHALASITGLPYNVVMDALTNPASEKAKYINDLLVSITTGTYVAPVNADTSAAIANVQNFIAYARTELAHLQTQMNGGVGLADGEGSMSPEQKAAYGNINAPAQYTAPQPQQYAAAPPPTAQQNFLPNLGGVTDGYNKAAAAADKAGAAGKKAGQDMANGIDEATAAAEDYGNRLKTALTSAFNQQYGLTKATDDYHSALNAITKKREDELTQLEDLKTKLKELNNERDKELITAGKAKIEAGISAKYGEGARQADYENQARTALDNAAAKQKDIDANVKATSTLADGIDQLTGYSDAAIANRAALRDLESKMLDMISAYAATGASQEQVRAYAQRLTAQFKVDVGQVWNNRVAMDALTGEMGRYVAAVDRVPRTKPTTVTADTGQAMGAMNALNGAIDWATRPREIPVSLNVEAYNRKMASIQAQIVGGGMADDPSLTAFRPGTFRPVMNLGGLVTEAMAGFASGGLIPGTPPANPRADNLMAQVDGKGMIKVRSREFIQPQEAVDYYGMDFMNAIRTLSLPKFSQGGSVSGGGGGGGGARANGPALVELTAENIAAIQRAGDRTTVLYADSTVLAQSVNHGNTILASTGAN